MKMVIAMFRPERLQAVKDALSETPVHGMTITHVTGRGEQMGITFTNRVGAFKVDELEKVRVEIAVEDDGLVDCVIDAIQDAAYTGNPGDGRIFVLPIERSIKIRNRGARCLFHRGRGRGLPSPFFLCNRNLTVPMYFFSLDSLRTKEKVSG
jgi:nitrogen regulatory protein P-II 1